jgi:hypothetical protein
MLAKTAAEIETIHVKRIDATDMARIKEIISRPAKEAIRSRPALGSS